MRDIPLISLKGDENLYLIVDGNGINNLGQVLYSTNEAYDAFPLYLDTRLSSLQEITPWIVDLNHRADTKFINWLLENERFEANAWLFTSSQDLERIVAHFQSLIFVLHPLGYEVILRFQDPRIANILMSHQTKQGLTRFSGPIESAWFLNRDEWINLSFNDEKCPDNRREDAEKKYVLTEDELKLLSGTAMSHFALNLSQHTRHHFPSWSQYNQGISSNDIINKATSMGFTSERAIYFFTNVQGYLGQDALATKQYPDIDLLLSKPSHLTPEQRIEKAAELAYQYSKA